MDSYKCEANKQEETWTKNYTIHMRQKVRREILSYWISASSSLLNACHKHHCLHSQKIKGFIEHSTDVVDHPNLEKCQACILSYEIFIT